MDRIVTFKRDGKVTKMTIGGFSDDPADDLSRLSRGGLEKILMSDKNSPIMIRVK